MCRNFSALISSISSATFRGLIPKILNLFLATLEISQKSTSVIMISDKLCFHFRFGRSAWKAAHFGRLRSRPFSASAQKDNEQRTDSDVSLQEVKVRWGLCQRRLCARSGRFSYFKLVAFCKEKNHRIAPIGKPGENMVTLSSLRPFWEAYV